MSWSLSEFASILDKLAIDINVMEYILNCRDEVTIRLFYKTTPLALQNFIYIYRYKYNTTNNYWQAFGGYL
jgi:hypothetical protein